VFSFPEVRGFQTIPQVMKPIPLICLAIAASLAGCVTGSRDDAAALQGTWKPVTGEMAGQPMSDSLLKVISLKLDNGKYVAFVGDEPDKGTYTVDSTTTPKSMVVTGTEGPNKGLVFPAIYELDGDTLRICYDLSGAKRPAEFKSAEGTKLFLVTYSRQRE
jgi:uncharacterized protein (TIGR03067 family)